MEADAIGEVIGREGWTPQYPRSRSESTPTSGRPGHASPPMVIPTVLPETIIAQVLRCRVSDIYEEADYQAYIRHLNTWKKKGLNWEEFRNGIDHALLEKWGDIHQRLRKQGFLFGFIKSVNGVERIIWAQRVKYIVP